MKTNRARPTYSQSAGLFVPFQVQTKRVGKHGWSVEHGQRDMGLFARRACEQREGESADEMLFATCHPSLQGGIRFALVREKPPFAFDGELGFCAFPRK